MQIADFVIAIGEKMNLILWDYDLSNQTDNIKEFFGAKEDCKICGLEERIPADFVLKAPVRGIVITALHSGWLKYHSEIADKYPFVTHWIFCVVGMSGAALKETISRQFEGSVAGDTYCELIFDDSNYSILSDKLSDPIKTKKRCLVVSLNSELAEEARIVLQEYLSDWEVAVSTDTKPEYTLCDCVLVVGNELDEMEIEKPDIHSIKVCFWINKPYFINKSDIATETVMLGNRMNKNSWNIGDYSSLVFFSSIHHEQVYQEIRQEEMTPAALLSDPLFVLWDDFGLPLVQSGLEGESFLSFLASHTVFPIMAARFCGNKKGRTNK